jgi:uncharacterized protein DUF1573
VDFKNLIICILLICLNSCKNGGSGHVLLKPVLSYDNPIVNVGQIKYGIPYSSNIKIRNTGNADLFIENMSTDCSCTIVDQAKKNIPPGDSLAIGYKVSPHTIGFFQQKIIIQSNGVNNPVMFVIRGKTIK